MHIYSTFVWSGNISPITCTSVLLHIEKSVYRQNIGVLLENAWGHKNRMARTFIPNMIMITNKTIDL